MSDMKQREIVYQEDEWDVHLVVTEATVLHGIVRTRLRIEGRGVEDRDLDSRLLLMYTYPDLIAATVSAEGVSWPLEFDDFLALPERLVIQWEQAVYELNAHWLPSAITDEGDSNPKVETSISD